MKKHITVAFLLAAPLLLACGRPRFEHGVVSVHGRTVVVEVARTERARHQGLMNRKKLEGIDGMFFVFDDENYYGFWMKNTYLPLDIAFINSNFKIVDVDSMAPLDTTLHCSLARFKYALELPLGSLERFRIKIGDTITYRPSP